MIEITRKQIKAIRTDLQLTTSQMEIALNLNGAKKSLGRTVRKWEAGERKIPGPVASLYHHMAHGWRPDNMPKEAADVRQCKLFE